MQAHCFFLTSLTELLYFDDQFCQSLSNLLTEKSVAPSQSNDSIEECITENNDQDAGR